MHQDISLFFTNIGDVYKEMGEYMEALEYHTKALNIDTQIHGASEHPRISRCYYGIGNGYFSLGKYTLGY